MSFEAFTVSTGVVALGEMGDKALGFVPIAWVHRIAAAVFAAIGVAVLAGAGAAP